MEWSEAERLLKWWHKRHYFSDETAEAVGILLAELDRRGQEIERLKAERDEWKRIAYVETKGNSCAWAVKFESAEREAQAQRERADRAEAAIEVWQREAQSAQERADKAEAERTEWQQMEDERTKELQSACADLDALRATSAELDSDRLRKHERIVTLASALRRLINTISALSFGMSYPALSEAVVLADAALCAQEAKP